MINNIFAANLKLKKEDGEASKEPTIMDRFKIHIQCIDPLNKALQSMKDCLDNLKDDDLKKMLIDSIESVGNIEKELLSKAGKALEEQIATIRGGDSTTQNIAELAKQISGEAPIAKNDAAVPHPVATPSTSTTPT